MIENLYMASVKVKPNDMTEFNVHVPIEYLYQEFKKRLIEEVKVSGLELSTYGALIDTE